MDDPDIGTRGLPAIGDWVVVSCTDPPAVRALGPRNGRLVRRDPGEPRPQILATGVDIVILTVPLDRPVNIARTERELVTAFDAGAEPVIALTKADTTPDVAQAVERLRPATADVPVFTVHALNPQSDPGVERLRAMVRESGTAVLLGPSGAGKSTLTNALVGAPVRATGDVRDFDHKGRHVTATRALLSLPGGGALIDTPGLRALGLWDAEEGLMRTFAEISETAIDCRFLDCSHDDEPGCAVRAAVGQHRIDSERLARYRALYDELVAAEEERQMAERLRRRRADRRAPR